MTCLPLFAFSFKGVFFFLFSFIFSNKINDFKNKEVSTYFRCLHWSSLYFKHVHWLRFKLYISHWRKIFKSWPRFANFPENFRDATDVKMILNKLVSMDKKMKIPNFLFNIYIFRASSDLWNLQVIEAKLSKVGPGLQNWKIEPSFT